MRNPILLTLVLLSSSAHAHDGVYGRWRPVDGLCTPAGGEISIGRFEIVQDEEVCVHGEALYSSGGAVPSTCSGGDGRERLVRLFIDYVGDRLTVTRDGRRDASDYVRCPEE